MSAAAITVGDAWFRLREPAEVALEWQRPDGTWCAVTNDGSVRVWIPADRGQPPRWSRTACEVGFPRDAEAARSALYVELARRLGGGS